MLDEELRDHINKIAVEIEKIEQTAKQKETYFTNKCNEEFDPKIKDFGFFKKREGKNLIS